MLVVRVGVTLVVVAAVIATAFTVVSHTPWNNVEANNNDKRLREWERERKKFFDIPRVVFEKKTKFSKLVFFENSIIW